MNEAPAPHPRRMQDGRQCSWKSGDAGRLLCVRNRPHLFDKARLSLVRIEDELVPARAVGSRLDDCRRAIRARKHIRPVRKLDHVWTARVDADHTRATLDELVVGENREVDCRLEPLVEHDDVPVARNEEAQCTPFLS